MRLLFAHDHIFDIDPSGGVYSEKLPYTVWRVYQERFTDIEIYGRHKMVAASPKPRATGLGVTFHALPSVSSTRGMFNRKRVTDTVKKALKTTDAVVVRLPSEIGLIAFWEAHRARKPILVEMVGSAHQSLWHHGTFMGKAYALVAWWRTRKALRHATHVIYVTQSFLQRRYPTRGQSVGISDVQLDVVNEDVLQQRLAQKITPAQVTRIGMIGQLLHYKGITTLIDACAILKQEGFELRVEFVGSGDPAPWLRHAVQAGLETECEFLGAKPTGEEIFKWLDTIDVYVQPSLTEGLSRATLEALSRGCPVIASRVGGLPEIVPPEYLARPGDSRELSGLIRKLILDTDARRSASVENFRRAKEYTRETLAQRRGQFLDQFIKTMRIGASLASSAQAVI
jgi:glycosyltransferase involved in cell wall biosynthesis